MAMIDMHRQYLKYIPALRSTWLTPLYDPLVRWTMREAVFKPKLMEQAHIRPGHYVLDLGCGTRTLTILINQRHPEVHVIALDVDPTVLALAKTKLAAAEVSISLNQGGAFELPYPNQAFDRILTSLLLHHLTRNGKRRTLREAFRVLRPSGELHVPDFGPPHHAGMAAVSSIVRWFEEAGNNMKGLLPDLVREAGYQAIEETARYSTAFGTLSLLKAVKPRRSESEEHSLPHKKNRRTR